MEVSTGLKALASSSILTNCGTLSCKRLRARAVPPFSLTTTSTAVFPGRIPRMRVLALLGESIAIAAGSDALQRTVAPGALRTEIASTVVADLSDRDGKNARESAEVSLAGRSMAALVIEELHASSMSRWKNSGRFQNCLIG